MKQRTSGIVVGAFGTILVGVTLVVASSCGVVSDNKYTEPFSDAPRGGTFDGPADVITMPDGFSNVATKCGTDGMRYSVIYHSDGPYGAVSVTADPNC